MRKTSFFQKKIKQFNVEFVQATVAAQNSNTLVFCDVDFSANLIATKTDAGVYISTKQATANKQV
jgi:hypothetical protein